MQLSALIASASAGPGWLAQFPGPGASFGPPPIFMFLFVTVFVVIIGGIVFKLFQGASEWSENNRQPHLTVPAKVVAKRTETEVHSHNNGNLAMNNAALNNPGTVGNFNNVTTSTTTTYFATFEFTSGDRKEFELSAAAYGLLAEHDTGNLTFQGTRYQGFDRTGSRVRETAAATAVPVTAQPPAQPAFCPFCGLEVTSDFKFCPQCGKPQPEYVNA